jgi:hypothetical protein
MAQNRARTARNPIHERRRIRINGRFDLPIEQAEAIERICSLFQKTANELLEIVDGLERRDEGRITAALDKLQAAKYVAADALTLPFEPVGPF